MGILIDELKLTKQDFKKFVDFVYESKGLDLSSYRQNFVYRRLRVRMLATRAKNYLTYSNLIKTTPAELDNFLNALSINVSEFFRDPDVFIEFKKKALLELIHRKGITGNRLIRAWSAGCATGQEAYSLAILINEEVKRKSGFLLRVLGTDVDKDALEKAMKAEYDVSRLKKISKEILEKYFIARYNGVCQIKETLRHLVSFRLHNLISEPPLKGMDIVFCRNVLIYLNRQQQDALFNKFYHSLNPKGYLVIGQAEAMFNRELFMPIDLRKKIYQKIER